MANSNTAALSLTVVLWLGASLVAYVANLPEECSGKTYTTFKWKCLSLLIYFQLKKNLSIYLYIYIAYKKNLILNLNQMLGKIILN